MKRDARRWLHVVVLVMGAAGCGAEGAETVDDDTSADPEAFQFAEDDRAAYVRVDRLGMPAVNTAVVASKDAYNAADPSDDEWFAPEIVASVAALHDALDDDIVAAGLVPCAVDDCIAAAGPLVIPDVLRIDPARPAGFPNGRRLEDPVMDVVIAVLLLDLSVDGQDVTTLAGLPLNPRANDRPFSGAMPYLAEPHG